MVDCDNSYEVREDTRDDSGPAPVRAGIDHGRLETSYLFDSDKGLLIQDSRTRMESIDGMFILDARSLVNRLRAERVRLMEVIAHLDELRGQVTRSTGGTP